MNISIKTVRTKHTRKKERKKKEKGRDKEKKEGKTERSIRLSKNNMPSLNVGHRAAET